MTRIGSPESFRRRRPAIKTADEVRSARRVGKYPARYGGRYHDDEHCKHLTRSRIYDNPDWRLLTAKECEEFGIEPCDYCV